MEIEIKVDKISMFFFILMKVLICIFVKMDSFQLQLFQNLKVAIPLNFDFVLIFQFLNLKNNYFIIFIVMCINYS